ncbi:hypothetical protein ACFPYJ_19740 [Paenibacillus solisilvae]|uniref:Uncharacterized protein n=1 Tax=Paenibacillus solisilvae TaxID=2486751 RepID=A0ABW0VZF4_9BACL
MWPSSKSPIPPKQIETYASTLQSLLEKSTKTPQGTANPSGYVAGIDFWIMYEPFKP